MPYALVTADFPGITTEQRKEIYARLKIKQWLKIKEFGPQIFTIWQASFREDVTDTEIKQATIEDFTTCAGSVKPKLVIMASEYDSLGIKSLSL